MMSPDPKAVEAPTETDDLLMHVAIATRAIRGLGEGDAIYRAAMRALSGARYPAFVLTLTDDHRRLRAAATSMSAPLVRALEAFVGVPLPRMRRALRDAPVLAEMLAEQAARRVPLADVCRELFGREIAGKITSLLGGQGFCVAAPLRRADRVLGLVGVVSRGGDARCIATIAQLAESVGTALCVAEILHNIQRARSTLSADHPAQQDLGEALRIAGQTAPNAPRSLIPPTPPVEKTTPWRGPQLHPRILLVEDEERLRNTTIKLLKSLEYDVQGVATGEHAITAYTRAKEHRQPFGVVLMDQTLAGRMGGVETLRILRSLDPEVRAILLSGQASDRNCEQMRKHGFRTCLPKPVSLEGLNAAIEEVLQPDD